MGRYAFLAEVRARPGVANPEGLAIERALPALGFAGIGEVSVGKAIRFVLEADGADEARALATELCERLLANPVIERFELSELGELSRLAEPAEPGELAATPPEGR
jgi:phosphoribosylformylglycinamidine synthase